MNKTACRGCNFVVVLAMVMIGGCNDSRSMSDPQPTAVANEPPEVEPFIDVTASAAFEFLHSPVLSGEFYMPEIMGSGVGLIDYDDDGDLDVYLVQSATLENSVTATLDHSDRLLKNLWAETQSLRFEDVTVAAGLVNSSYGMGVAVADFDQDGFDDLLITNAGPNLLMRNRGDGTFENVTVKARIRGDDWSSSAAFVDFDADGDADIYIANYVGFSIRQNTHCTSDVGLRDYCGPQTYPAVPDQLLKNLGDGTFVDVSESAGLHRAYGPGLGVTVSDFNDDGFVDIYVANDGDANQLWMNSGQGRFSDTGFMSGTSVNADGVAEAGMGVMAGDFDNDGDDDLFMTHLIAESNTLYINTGAGQFYDASDEVSLAASSLAKTGFGAGWIDYDNDGLLDVFVANGNVKLESARIGLSDYPYEQTNQLFHNTQVAPGRFQFTDISARAGKVFEALEVSRGAAFGDINNDGYTDIVVSNNHGPARLLVNQLKHNNWIGVIVKDSAHRHPDGAGVALFVYDAPLIWRKVERSGSYLSSHDPRVRLGLGADPAPSSVTLIVQWPDGQHEIWSNLAPGRYHVLVREEGERIDRNTQTVRGIND